MIEFKAECGHTVRARDEDAGSSVRCSYCGRTANVPQDQDEGLDLLLRESDLTARAPLHIPAPRKRFLGGWFRRSDRAAPFDPWPIIMRMIYFAVLVSVIVVITTKFVLPMFEPRGPKSPTTAAAVPSDTGSIRRPRHVDSADPARTSDRGYVHRQLLSGLLVLSVPSGATAYVVPADNAPSVGRVNKAGNAVVCKTGTSVPRLGDGNYVVEIAMPWNDPGLKRYADYTDFRREVERSSQNQRQNLVERYFIPDEAGTVLFDETEEQKFIVRQYRNVEVQEGRSSGVRALFLPRIRQGDEPGFQIEPLVVQYIPDVTTFVFDEKDAIDELEYYGVAPGDRPWMIKALSRMGIVPYITANRRTIVFKVGLEDGLFSAKVVREFGR